MSTVADIVIALKATGLTYRYGYFGSGPGDATDTTPMPRIVYRFKLTPRADYADGISILETINNEVPTGA